MPELSLLDQLLNDPDLYSLVDEFFFEYHYDCAIMNEIWHSGGPSTFPEESRETAMKAFRRLRELGIRSHIWP